MRVFSLQAGRKMFFAFALIFCSLTAGAQIPSVELLYPKDFLKVGKWEKAEFGINLPAEISTKVSHFMTDPTSYRVTEKINPFDPDQLSLEATFTLIGDRTVQHKVYGFYYEPFRRLEDAGKWSWIKDRNQHPFRVRFAPDKTGSWECIIKVFVNKTELVHQAEIMFGCVESNSPGEVLMMNTTGARNHYLKFSDNNQMFFPVGMNLVWTHLEGTQAQDFQLYNKWMGQLEKAGGNYIQLSMVPYTQGVEWGELNNYRSRMNLAWEMDQLVDLAHEKNIYVNLLFLIHDEFMSGEGWFHANNGWKNNCYNRDKNGGKTNAVNALDFFTDASCKINFKKRLRYIMARYGYSVNIPVLELLSEVDNAVPGYNDKTAAGVKIRQEVKQWFVDMKTYIEKELGYENKLVSASYAQNKQIEDRGNRIFSVADVVLLHFYGRDKYTNFKQRNVHVQEMMNNGLSKDKPVIFDEMGASVFPTLDRCSDITFHNNLWATSFMGCYGTGQNWWWDNALLSNGYEKSLTGIKQFLKDENFTLTEFVPEAWANNGSYKKKTKFEAYYLKAVDGTKMTGWVHNTSFWWANLKNSNACIADLIAKNNGSSIDAADNSAYAKDYNKENSTGTPVSYTSIQLTLKMPLGKTDYIIKWYDTVTGQPTGMQQQATSSRSGKIKFDIPDIKYPENAYGGLGFKIVKFSR